MTKYYCDLCGREISTVEKYILPDLRDKDFKDSRGNLIRKNFEYMPTEMELCRDCRNTIGRLIHTIKQTPAEMYIGKRMKIKWEE